VLSVTCTTTRFVELSGCAEKTRQVDQLCARQGGRKRAGCGLCQSGGMAPVINYGAKCGAGSSSKCARLSMLHIGTSFSRTGCYWLALLSHRRCTSRRISTVMDEGCTVESDSYAALYPWIVQFRPEATGWSCSGFSDRLQTCTH